MCVSVYVLCVFCTDYCLSEAGSRIIQKTACRHFHESCLNGISLPKENCTTFSRGATHSQRDIQHSASFALSIWPPTTRLLVSSVGEEGTFSVSFV